MFDKLDGSGRLPRKAQTDMLVWLEKVWNDYDTFCVLAPTAAGKSFIARAVQIEFDADYVTINNELVKQYCSEYNRSGKNFAKAHCLIGRKHYIDPKIYESCVVMSRTKDFNRSLVFNPITYARYKDDPQHQPRGVVILDEADQHLGLLLEYAATRVKLTPKEKGKVQPTSVEFLSILEDRLRKLQRKEQNLKTTAQYANYVFIKDMLYGNAHYYAISIEEEDDVSYMVLKPLKLTLRVIRKLFFGQKVILLSGTLFKTDVTDLIGVDRKMVWYEMDSPIPVERRAIIFKPYENLMSYGYDKEEVCMYVDRLLDSYKMRPALIHTTYSDAPALAVHLKHETVSHTKDTKRAAIGKLESVENLVLLGSGMSTGLDLKDEKCRLNIILKARFPNIADSYVKKRMALEDGAEWYANQTIREVIQAAGRSTRTENDYSITILCDGRVLPVFLSHWRKMPSYFKKALILYIKDDIVDTYNFFEQGGIHAST
jgi:Rad3-related DNA helicase